jgi:hypothetical protein
MHRRLRHHHRSPPREIIDGFAVFQSHRRLDALALLGWYPLDQNSARLDRIQQLQVHTLPA